MSSLEKSSKSLVGTKLSFNLDLNRNCTSEEDCKSSKMTGNYYSSIDKYGAFQLNIDATLVTKKEFNPKSEYRVAWVIQSNVIPVSDVFSCGWFNDASWWVFADPGKNWTVGAHCFSFYANADSLHKMEDWHP